MKISSIRLQNFRCFLDQTISFGDYTCLVGPGGAGKSTILTALRIFFRDATGSPTDLLNLHEEDFHKKDTSKDIIITVSFSNLEEEAQEDFKHYFRHGQLIVSAVAKWDDQSRTAEVKQYGQRLGMEAFVPFFRAEGDGATVAQLKPIYTSIRESCPDLPAPGTKPAMIDALHEFEGAHQGSCALLPSEDQFYGVSKGSNRLQKYLQWVFIPAVKDASTEQLEAKKTALGLLLERTVRSKMSFADQLATLKAEAEARFQTLLDQNQNVLETLSLALTARLQDWAHPEASLTLTWRNDPSKHISITEPLAEVLAGEGHFRGTLARFGHGFQRSFLLALLQELSGCPNTGNPRLLLACEEPELYQHPPQARHLSSVLQRLSGSNTQVIASTHSPYFISGKGFQDVRVIRQALGEDQPSVKSLTFQELANKLAEALGAPVPLPSGMEFKVEQSLQAGLNEMFFSPVLVLVEGLEDVAFISTHFLLSDRTEEFRRLGCHIVPTSGKGSMIQPLAIAMMLDIPTYVIFDADGDDITKPGRREQHERDNTAILRLCNVPNPAPFPSAIFQTANLTVWPTKIAPLIEEEIGKPLWEGYEVSVRKKRNLQSVPDLEKNMLFIGHVLAEAYQAGKSSVILDELCNRILAFARAARAGSSVTVRP